MAALNIRLNLGRLLRRDGWLAKCVESIPIAGFFLVLLDIRNGDKDRALRACAKCVYAIVVVIGSKTIGARMGGGCIGLGFGAACTTPLALHLQSRIAEHIQDPHIRNEVLVDLASKGVLEEAVANGLVFGVGVYFSKIIANLMGSVLVTMGLGRMLAGWLHGVLHWRLSAGSLLDRDGWVLKFAESIPVVGFLPALFDLVNGDKDRALRACAKCLCAIAAVIGPNTLGKSVGGGSIGLSFGAAWTTPLALHLQSRIAEHIRDLNVRNEVLVDLASREVLGEAIINGLLYGIGTNFNKPLMDLMSLSLTKMGARRMLVAGLGGLLDQFGDLLIRDGWPLKTVESLPVIGFILALVDFCRGDQDRALCASAKCTYATVVAAASAMGGLAGEDPIATGLCAACTTPIAMTLQSWVADSAPIQDPRIRDEVLFDFTMKMLLGNSIHNGLVFGAGALFNEPLATLIGPIPMKIGVWQLLFKLLCYVFRQALL